nr:hypothetical protein [uncultured Shimia sp.]
MKAQKDKEMSDVGRVLDDWYADDRTVTKNGPSECEIAISGLSEDDYKALWQLCADAQSDENWVSENSRTLKFFRERNLVDNNNQPTSLLSRVVRHLKIQGLWKAPDDVH